MQRISFEELYFYHGDIGEGRSHGIERSRGEGYGDIFGYADLDRVSVAELGRRVRLALDGTNVPRHPAWQKQREHLEGLLALGPSALYALATFDLRLKADGRRALSDGCHRGLALWLLGEPDLDLSRARLALDSWEP